MEVTTDEEAQAVFLEGMEGAQYITIQRIDGESLGKGVPLLTLNGELISEGMVVDMINAGVGSEYSGASQYYETDDLLPHEMTEEDGKLAALVAVQLQQHQKQQQLQSQSQHDDSTLPDVSHLATLSPVNTYAIQAISEPEPPPVYTSLQAFKRGHNVKEEFINVKSESDLEVSAESSEDAAPPSGLKRSLPHKKRIPRKLKQQTEKSSVKSDSGKIVQTILSLDSSGHADVQGFSCELCGSRFGGQLKFFEHLKVNTCNDAVYLLPRHASHNVCYQRKRILNKTHYEPVKQETRIAQSTNTNIIISVPDTVQGLDNTVIEEFSEPEDLMEGIRGVVEETGAHIDEESETPLSEVNTGPTLWSITEVPETLGQKESEISTINKQDLHEKYETEIPETTKKTKSQKARKVQNDELACPQCDRSFHHKNSLVYHMRSHSGERPHHCEVCGKSFFAASALKVHKRLHSGDKPYKCEDCGRHFRQWGDLKYHSMSIHSEQRQFQCEYCGKDFARKYSLIVHRRVHTGEKNYRCEYCNKTFRASSYLQNHRRIHTGEKPHPCTVCGKPFRVRSDMKRHMHTHTNGKSDGSAANKIAIGKTVNEDSDDKGCHARTIQDLVRELKLEMEPDGVVEIVPPEDNPESILPHEGQTLEYTVATNNDGSTDRDPLEAADRTSETLQYFFL